MQYGTISDIDHMDQTTATCTSCKSPFVIESDDLIFYEKFGVPAPKMCFSCRSRLRLAFKNERSYYHRKCDKCGKETISMYSTNKPYTVWCYDCWFSDDWDAAEYAQDYDPSKPFLEQFAALWRAVPKVALIGVRNVNSEYVNISADNKECYMIVESSNNENCTHCYWIQQCHDCVDTSFAHRTELSYESDDCYSCYGLRYSKGCSDSRDSFFLLDCRGCSDCIGCMNLRNKKYCIFNEQLTKEEYEKAKNDMRLDTASGVAAVGKDFSDFVKTQPLRYAEIYNAPGSSGDYINNAKNCRYCFHCYESEDSKYGVHVWEGAKDCMDVDTAGRGAEHVYNAINSGINVSHYVGTAVCWSCAFMEYSYYCFNSNHCFGSVGLRKKDYHILNKPYGKGEFEVLRGKIVAEMRGKGEYGEFFPPAISTFGYNESAAQEQFPLTKEVALALGFSWEDTPRGTFGKETIAWERVPDSIRDLGALDPTKEVFLCTTCSKNYRIIPAELQFYKRLEIPLPRRCPDCRHERRFAARGPNQLFERSCSCSGDGSAGSTYANASRHFHGNGGCPNKFTTNHIPDYDGMVYCEQCYNAEIK